MKKSIYSNDYNYLTKQLRTARIEAGLNQKEVAGKLNRTQSYVSKIESGQLRVDVIQLNELAEFYGKSLDYFLKKKTI